MDSRRLSISFLYTFLWLFPNIKQKRIPLNDNIVWCKNSSATIFVLSTRKLQRIF